MALLEPPGRAVRDRMFAAGCYSAFDIMLLIPSTAVPDARVAAAYVIFLASYLVFAMGKFPGLKIDRPGAAIIGAVAMFAFRVVQPSDALRFIDFATLVLLFSMMLIVGNLRLVGFFEWNAEVVLRRLKPTQLLPAVIFTCGFLSAFLVNDIVCLVMVPFVLASRAACGCGRCRICWRWLPRRTPVAWPRLPEIRRTC